MRRSKALCTALLYEGSFVCLFVCLVWFGLPHGVSSSVFESCNVRDTLSCSSCTLLFCEEKP